MDTSTTVPDGSKRISADDMRLSSFANLYLDKDSETYGNATASAIKAFKLKIPEQYNYARRIGSAYVAKCNAVAQVIMENHGATLPYMIQFALNEMQSAKTSQSKNKWWNDLMNISMFKKAAEVQFVQNINTTNNVQQNNITLTADDAKKFNENFLAFINKGGELPA